MTCKIILAVARTIIRELITDFVGKVASMLLRYPPPVTPAAIPEAVNMASGYAQKIMGWVQKVRKAFANAGQARGKILGDPLKAAKEAVVDELPEKAVVESVKETAKPIAVGFDDSVEEQGQETDAAAGEPQRDSYLNDGPGPHRVSGEL